jgi:HNH endonuclease
MILCSIPDCGRPHKGLGWCSKHYFRWKRHGDPLYRDAEAPAPKRAAIKWIKDNANFSGAECLIWPFTARMTNGYGLVWWKGRKDGAHRVMCEMVHGPAPSSKHQTAHSCGNGTGGCVSPRHLRWATPIENDGDKEKHGTRIRGEQIPWSKLTEDDVCVIRALIGKKTDTEIADQFGVSDGAIYLIRKGVNWKHVR